MNIDKMQFAIDWNKATSVIEVAKKHGIEVARATQLAHRLRKAGVKLNNMNKARAENYDAINKALAVD